MNMKTLTVLILMGFLASAQAQHPTAEEIADIDKSLADANAQIETSKSTSNDVNPNAAEAYKQQIAQANSLMGVSKGVKCNAALMAHNEAVTKAAGATLPADEFISECQQLQKFSKTDKGIPEVEKDDRTKKSIDGKIVCNKAAAYTLDFDACVKSLNYYNAAVAAETAMNLQQSVRTDLKNKSIQQDATKRLAEGDSQAAMYDAAIASNKHQEDMQREKVWAYSSAVAALSAAYTMIPGEKKVISTNCTSTDSAVCQKTVMANKSAIIANSGARASLASAVTEFVAKGAAAGIAMGQFGNAANQIEDVKTSLDQEQSDLMMNACAFNPADPACSGPGVRTAGDSFASGGFNFEGSGSNNAFNLGPSADGIEAGAPTNLDDNSPIAGINSPFGDEAKIAKGIVDPAAAAQVQATGGAGGGGGGAGGGMGGGSASLGSDIAGANKDPDKEANIKTNKVSGSYNAAGGGGFKGVGGGKDDPNPFASLFDAKSGSGGIEEDRSIASGDIDGAASGLFQKISKRYGLIQADKRIEAKNLE